MPLRTWKKWVLKLFNIQGLIDEKGVIENLGIDNTEQIRKKATKAKARAQWEIAEQQKACFR